MYCRNCGKEIKDGNEFCTNCGQPINKIRPTTKVQKEKKIKVKKEESNNQNIVISKKAVTRVSFIILVLIIIILMFLLLRKDNNVASIATDNIVINAVSEQQENIISTDEQQQQQTESQVSYGNQSGMQIKLNGKVVEVSDEVFNILGSIFVKYQTAKDSDIICTNGEECWILDEAGRKVYFDDLTSFENALRQCNKTI